MAFSRRRRYSSRYRRKSRNVPGSTRSVRRSTGQSFQMYAYGGPPRKLIHMYPEQLASAQYLCFANSFIPREPTPQPNPTADLMNQVPRGDGISMRHATKIYMRNLVLNMAFVNRVDEVVGDLTRVVTIYVIYDREPNGLLPAVGSFLDDPSEPLTLTSIAGRERFDILYRKTMMIVPNYVFNGTGVVGTPSPSWARYLSLKIPVFRPATFYPSETSGYYPNLQKGALWLFCHSSDVSADSNLRMYYTHRLSFLDVE